jgi:DHA2 family multidrug resistance protein
MDQQSTIEHGFRRVIITITVIACSLLELIDTSIVNVATTQLMGNLGATLSEISWVVAAYSIANVIIVPMSTWLSIKLGRKYYFGGSVILFTVASALCGFSTNIWELVFFRFVQGIGGGALLATSQTILTEIYAPEERGKASAMYGLGVIMGPTLGPTLGGYLIDNFDWPMIFFVNIPIGIAAAFLTFVFIKDISYGTPEMKKARVDWQGILLLIFGVGALQLLLEKGDSEDWFQTTYITISAIVAVVGLVSFVLWELYTDHPVVDLRVLFKGNVAIGTLLSFILGFGLFSSVFIYPVFVQRFLGFTALQTGLSLLPGALLSGFMMPIVGGLMAKGVKPKFMLPLAFLGFAAFTFWMSQIITGQTGEEAFFWPLILRGISLGFLFVPLTTMSLGGLTGKDIGSAAGLTAMIRQLGGSFGVAICSTFISHLTYVHRADMIGKVTNYDPAATERINQLTQGMLSKAGDLAKATQMAYGTLEMTIVKQATVMTYIDTFMYLGVFFVIVAPIVLFAKDTAPVRKEDLDAAGH